MNANTIISEDMTLEEKLAAIDAAMEKAVENARQTSAETSSTDVPVDPADLTMCIGCQ